MLVMMVIMMMMVVIIVMGMIYELNMTARRGGTSNGCHYIKSHKREFIDGQEAKSEKLKKEGPGQWGDQKTKSNTRSHIVISQMTERK